DRRPRSASIKGKRSSSSKPFIQALSALDVPCRCPRIRAASIRVQRNIYRSHDSIPRVGSPLEVTCYSALHSVAQPAPNSSIEGTLDRIVFQNTENSFTVA